jgi:hypothetical protein
MVKTWITTITAYLLKWGIPESVMQNLSSLAAAAESALDTAKNESTRTPVATARCKEAFDALTADMRDIKKRYFLSPPLTDSDFVALELNPPDNTHTPSSVPTAQVKVETYLVGRHELGVKIVYVTGSPNDPANKGYRIWYSVLAPGETPPTSPEDLRKSFFTMRKKDLLQFNYNESGQTVYFAVQIENSGGKQGPWGPMVNALIP